MDSSAIKFSIYVLAKANRVEPIFANQESLFTFFFSTWQNPVEKAVFEVGNCFDQLTGIEEISPATLTFLYFGFDLNFLTAHCVSPALNFD